ncbi:hypothetical protein JOM56_001772 [Amanita muscaria]
MLTGQLLVHSALWTHQLLIITAEDFLLLVRRKTLPSDPRQFWTFSTTESVNIRCPCLVRREEHVTEGSELRCPEARCQESSPPMLSTDDGLSGAAKVALLVNGTSTTKLPFPPTPIQARAADIGALRSRQPGPPRPISTGLAETERVVDSEACGWTKDDDDEKGYASEQKREREQKEQLEGPTTAQIMERLRQVQRSNNTKSRVPIAHTTNQCNQQIRHHQTLTLTLN